MWTNNSSNFTNETNVTSLGCGQLYDFIVMGVLAGALCLLGCAGNVLSMICLSKDKSKTATPFLLVSLEVADTLFLLAVFCLRVFTSFVVYHQWFPEEIVLLCMYLAVYVYPVSLIAETASIWITVLVTVNRYVSVCRPYEVSSWCTVQQAKRQVIIIWILSIALHFVRFFEQRVVRGARNSVEVTSMGNHDVYKILYGSILYCIVMFLVPLVTLIILNYRLIKGLQQTKRRRAQLLKSKGATSSKSEEDITLTLIVVVLVFVVTQMPALFTQILRATLARPAQKCPYFYFYCERLSDFLVVVNSSVNFIIYCFCSRKFRKILEGLICMSSNRSQQDLEQSQNDHTMHTYT